MNGREPFLLFNYIKSQTIKFRIIFKPGHIHPGFSILYYMTKQELFDELYKMPRYDRLPRDRYIDFCNRLWDSNQTICLLEKTDDGYRVVDTQKILDISVSDFKKYLKTISEAVERMPVAKATQYLEKLYEDYKGTH